MARDVEFKDRAGKTYHISKNLELSEYTGFKDRLGKKIYENDVIEFNNTRDDEYGDPHIERRRDTVTFQNGAWTLIETELPLSEAIKEEYENIRSAIQ